MTAHTCSNKRQVPRVPQPEAAVPGVVEEVCPAMTGTIYARLLLLAADHLGREDHLTIARWCFPSHSRYTTPIAASTAFPCCDPANTDTGLS